MILISKGRTPLGKVETRQPLGNLPERPSASPSASERPPLGGLLQPSPLRPSANGRPPDRRTPRSSTSARPLGKSTAYPWITKPQSIALAKTRALASRFRIAPQHLRLDSLFLCSALRLSVLRNVRAAGFRVLRVGAEQVRGLTLGPAGLAGRVEVSRPNGFAGAEVEEVLARASPATSVEVQASEPAVVRIGDDVAGVDARRHLRINLLLGLLLQRDD